MRYFRGGRDTSPNGTLRPTDEEDGGKKGKKKKAKKKTSKASKKDSVTSGGGGTGGEDWTWRDHVEVVKWTDTMIEVLTLATMFNQTKHLFFVPELSASLGPSGPEQDGAGVLRLHHEIHGRPTTAQEPT